jgi:REP element-mobilizing transposase RayT
MELKKSVSQKLRMDERDYSASGWYFLTLGADFHKHLFGKVVTGEMCANELGQLVEKFWDEIPLHYDHVELGARQVMPNHFHGLIRIVRSGGKGIGEIMNVFKGAVTREWRKNFVCSRYIEKGRLSLQSAPAVAGKYDEKERVWSPNYYDVICFKAEDLEIRRRYIHANPRRWALKDVPVGLIRKSKYKGNVGLLKANVNYRALRVSRKTSEEKLEQLINELQEFDGIVCSTFFSSGERLVLESLLDAKVHIIWILPTAMPEQIPVKWTDAFLESRALWISSFPDKLESATRESCCQANQWIEKFCSKMNGKNEF